MWLLLRFRWSARMRDLAERITRFRPLQTAIYWVQFIVVVSVADFPAERVRRLFPRAQVWTAESDLRSVDARSGDWAGRRRRAGSDSVVPLFGLVRRLGKTWWVWGAIVMMVFIAFVSLIAPVYISPLFNKYTTSEGRTSQRSDPEHGAGQRNSRERRLRI